MMLTAQAICDAIDAGEIDIKPFNRERLGPNSYDLSLHNELLIYKDAILDMKKDNHVERIKIPDDGYLLQPGTLYLARTQEWTASDYYVPMLEGRSSVGRLGLYADITAGFGNLGSSGCWTLELSCVQPLVIYAGVRICQVYFLTTQGERILQPEKNRYKDAEDIQPSLLWKEF